MSDQHPPPGPAARGPYQVWHRTAEGFTPVALVHGGNLLAALVFTMSRADGHWQDGDQVTALVPDARSTDLGDVIVGPEGVAYELAVTDLGPGGVPIDFSPYREQQALFAEWIQNYAAGRERGGKMTLEALERCGRLEGPVHARHATEPRGWDRTLNGGIFADWMSGVRARAEVVEKPMPPRRSVAGGLPAAGWETRIPIRRSTHSIS